MDIREDGQSILAFHLTQHLESFLQSRSSERADTGAVGLIERCLEDDLHPQGLTDSHKFLCYRIEQLGRFDDTRSCNKHLFHVAKVQKVLHSTKLFIRFYDYYSLFAQKNEQCS